MSAMPTSPVPLPVTDCGVCGRPATLAVRHSRWTWTHLVERLDADHDPETRDRITDAARTLTGRLTVALLGMQYGGGSDLLAPLLMPVVAGISDLLENFQDGPGWFPGTERPLEPDQVHLLEQIAPEVPDHLPEEWT